MSLLQYYKHVVQSIEKFAQKVSFNNCFLVTLRLHFVVKLFWWGNLMNLLSLIFRKYSLFYAVPTGVQDPSSVCDGFCYQTIETSGKMWSDLFMSESIAQYRNLKTVNYCAQWCFCSICNQDC